jgi:chemotaxis protein CheX
MVGLAGVVSGVLSLRCSAAVCTEIAARMLGLTRNDAESHATDAVGETCNMVAGAFKAKIPELQSNCMLSVPTVITGDNYTVHSLAVANRIEVPLLFGNRVIRLALEISS